MQSASTQTPAQASRLWEHWLFAVGLGLVAFGTIMAFFNDAVFFEFLFNNQIESAFWPDGETPAAAREFRRWVYGAWGATVAGWGIIIVYLARFPFRARARWAWLCLVVGLSYWFVIDTGLSLYFGVDFNAFVVNVPVLVLIAIPLLATRKSFFAVQPAAE